MKGVKLRDHAFWETAAKRLLGFKGTAGGTYDLPTFWYELDEQVFVRGKVEFCTIDARKSYMQLVISSNMRDEDPRHTGG